MTGFGKAFAELENKKVTVEVKSLNSKQLDLLMRVPPLYREKEMTVRNLLAKKLERGKVDFAINIENIGVATSVQINQGVVEAYYMQITESAKKLGIDVPHDWFQTILRLPESLKTDGQELDEQEWLVVEAAVNEAIDRLIDFRKQEGEMLERLFTEKIMNIANLRKEVELYETERIEKIKQRITDALLKIENFDYDKNRFEQEMIFYIEKLDINEEKDRLENHLNYFLETLQTGVQGQGKKLGFITQEIGREINTMGSKSNHAEMQRIIVRMKDELEQIKEQVLNVM
jgi:uncharacterized protein (TIGR00255 family)